MNALPMSAGTPQEDVAVVREALHTLTDTSFGDVDQAAVHENSLEGYAALDRLEQRLARQADAIRQARMLASHNAERHTGFVHIGRILAAAEPKHGADEARGGTALMQKAPPAAAEPEERA